MSHPFEVGTRIRKVMSEEGDLHQVGSEGKVLGHLKHPTAGYGYFVHWDGDPSEIIGFVIAKKVAQIEPEEGYSV
jgi:hypothetical protein